MSSLTPDDKALLRSARLGLEPTREDRSRIRRGVFARLGIGLGAATSTLSASTTAGAGTPLVTAATATATVTMAKLLGGLLVVGGLVGTSALVLRQSRPAGRTASGMADVARTGPPSPAAAPRGSALLRDAATATRGNSPSLSGLPVPPVATVSAEEEVRDRAILPPVPPRPTRHPNPINEIAGPSVPPASTAPAEVLGEMPAASPPSIAGPATTTTPEPRSTPLSGPQTVAAEARLLRDADAALRAGNPSRALALLTEHAASFPSGILVEERNAERIVVLCALGRSAEAREAALVFLGDHARSPLAARVRDSCAVR